MEFQPVANEEGHDEFALGKMEEGEETQRRQRDGYPLTQPRQQNDRNVPDDRPITGIVRVLFRQCVVLTATLLPPLLCQENP